MVESISGRGWRFYWPSQIFVLLDTIRSGSSPHPCFSFFTPQESLHWTQTHKTSQLLLFCGGFCCECVSVCVCVCDFLPTLPPSCSRGASSRDPFLCLCHKHFLQPGPRCCLTTTAVFSLFFIFQPVAWPASDPQLMDFTCPTLYLFIFWSSRVLSSCHNKLMENRVSLIFKGIFWRAGVYFSKYKRCRQFSNKDIYILKI